MKFYVDNYDDNEDVDGDVDEDKDGDAEQATHDLAWVVRGGLSLSDQCRQGSLISLRHVTMMTNCFKSHLNFAKNGWFSLCCSIPEVSWLLFVIFCNGTLRLTSHKSSPSAFCF